MMGSMHQKECLHSQINRMCHLLLLHMHQCRRFLETCRYTLASSSAVGQLLWKDKFGGSICYCPL
jgi:hypothetical protein